MSEDMNDPEFLKEMISGLEDDVINQTKRIKELETALGECPRTSN